LADLHKPYEIISPGISNYLNVPITLSSSILFLFSCCCIFFYIM